MSYVSKIAVLYKTAPVRLKTDRKQNVITFISNQTVLQIDTNTKISNVWTDIINKNRKYCENKQKGQSFTKDTQAGKLKSCLGNIKKKFKSKEMIIIETK